MSNRVAQANKGRPTVTFGRYRDPNKFENGLIKLFVKSNLSTCNSKEKESGDFWFRWVNLAKLAKTVLDKSLFIETFVCRLPIEYQRNILSQRISEKNPHILLIFKEWVDLSLIELEKVENNSKPRQRANYRELILMILDSLRILPLNGNMMSSKLIKMTKSVTEYCKKEKEKTFGVRFTIEELSQLSIRATEIIKEWKRQYFSSKDREKEFIPVYLTDCNPVVNSLVTSSRMPKPPKKDTFEDKTTKESLKKDGLGEGLNRIKTKYDTTKEPTKTVANSIVNIN